MTLVFDDTTGVRQYSDLYLPYNSGNEGWYARAVAFFDSVGETPSGLQNEELQGLTGKAKFILDEYVRDDGSVYYSVKPDAFFAKGGPEPAESKQQSMKEYVRSSGYIPEDDVPF